jgi:hypothetical protein
MTEGLAHVAVVWAAAAPLIEIFLLLVTIALLIVGLRRN